MKDWGEADGPGPGLFEEFFNLQSKSDCNRSCNKLGAMNRL